MAPLGVSTGGIKKASWEATSGRKRRLTQIDWIASLIATSRRTGGIPHTLPAPYDVVNWVPVNFAAEMIAKMSAKELTRPRTGGPGNCLSVLHILNPKPAPWSTIATAVQQTVRGGKILLVKYQYWLADLQIHTQSAADTIMDTHPAVRLLEWFEDMEVRKNADGPVLSFSTRNAEKMVPMLSRIPEAERLSLIRMWIRELTA